MLLPVVLIFSIFVASCGGTAYGGGNWGGSGGQQYGTSACETATAHHFVTKTVVKGGYTAGTSTVTETETQTLVSATTSTTTETVTEISVSTATETATETVSKIIQTVVGHNRPYVTESVTTTVTASCIIDPRHERRHRKIKVKKSSGEEVEEGWKWN